MSEINIDRNKLPIINAFYLWERILLIDLLLTKNHCNCMGCKSQVARHIREIKEELKKVVRQP